MKKATLALSVLMLIFSFPTLALGEGADHEGHHKKMHGHGKKHTSYARQVLSKAGQLHLSDDQLGNVMRIHLQHRQTQKTVRKKLHTSMAEAYQGLMDPATDDQAIRKAVKKYTDALLNELVKNALQERREIKSILTEEQKEQLLSIKKTCEGKINKEG